MPFAPNTEEAKSIGFLHRLGWLVIDALVGLLGAPDDVADEVAAAVPVVVEDEVDDDASADEVPPTHPSIRFKHTHAAENAE